MSSSSPQYAVNDFKEIVKSMPSKLSDASDKELRNLYRDLRYINSLKSSTVKGAKEVQEKFKPIADKLEALSENTRDKFWTVYGKLYEATGGRLEQFKYELFETNIDYIYGGGETDTLEYSIISLYDETLKELGSNATDEQIKVLFTSKLKTLFK